MSNTNDVLKEISRDTLMNMLNVDKNIKLLDVRNQSHYENEHIKGAISLPLEELNNRVKNILKPDDTVITYCSNSQCPASYTAAKTLLSLGYKNVLSYTGGIADYKKANLPLEGVSNVINKSCC